MALADRDVRAARRKRGLDDEQRRRRGPAGGSASEERCRPGPAPKARATRTRTSAVRIGSRTVSPGNASCRVKLAAHIATELRDPVRGQGAGVGDVSVAVASQRSAPVIGGAELQLHRLLPELGERDVPGLQRSLLRSSSSDREPPRAPARHRPDHRHRADPRRRRGARIDEHCGDDEGRASEVFAGAHGPHRIALRELPTRDRERIDQEPRVAVGQP